MRQGIFQTAVLSRGCGLASTPREPLGPHGEVQVADAGHLVDMTGLALARMAYSSSPLEAAIGMAAINSLLDIDEDRCKPLNARDLLAEKGKNKRVAIVGHFPFVEQLRRSTDELWVIEREPREGDFPESEAATLLPEADIVGITGAAFTNHTIGRLLDWCRPDSFVVVLGGTTPLSPVLFDYGVDAVSGARVVDHEAVLRCVSQGANFRQVQGIRLLTLTR